VVNKLHLNIVDGQITSLLGPSGSGKTTILRLLAGFIQPQAGDIFLGNKNITGIPSEKRNFGMVFQNYALFQNMNVRENIAYGLKLRKLDKKTIKKKVERILDLVQMTNYSERHVEELSGGQQQRVAIARALIIEPSMLLMDEPLSNLDASLRQEMRQEIRMLQKKLGITTLFITHDQQEALEISDQVAIIDQGEIIQKGTPYQIYKEPVSLNVARKFGYLNKLTEKQKEAFRSFNSGSVHDYERPE
jgi:ABC-type Fe3+/spermidine/putrescine transport system ATPase subunit